MQIIDTGYALRDSTRYLIASQLAMDLSGYNYTAIFQAICNDPDSESSIFAKIAISSYKDKKFPTRAIDVFIKGKAEIFLLDLLHFETLVCYFKALVAKLYASDTYCRKLPSIVTRTLSIDPTYFLIDFYAFIHLLMLESDPELEAYLYPVINIKEKSLLTVLSEISIP